MQSKNINVTSGISLIFIFLFVFHLKTNAQEGDYWIGLSAKNPALIGTSSDWVWGIVGLADIPNYNDAYNNFALISDYEISPQAGSLGANFIRKSVGDEKAYLAELVYAYTLTGKKSREWNFGASAGVEGLKRDNSSVGYNNPKASYLKTNIGVLYHSRKLDLGLSYAFFNELKNNYSSGSLIDNFVTFITAYRFFITEKFVIEPNLRMDFGGGDNDAYGGLHFEYDNIAWIGYETAGTEGVRSISTGASISKRFRMALRYSFSDYYQFGRAKYYQITMGYNLKK